MTFQCKLSGREVAAYRRLGPTSEMRGPQVLVHTSTAESVAVSIDCVGLFALTSARLVLSQGVMAKRILGLLWRTSLASPVSSGLDMTLCFADVLRDYALINRSSDTRNIALDYVSQLVQELNGTEKALPALRVLSHLVAHSSNHTVSHCAVLLLLSYNLVSCNAAKCTWRAMCMCAAVKFIPYVTFVGVHLISWIL